MKKLGWMTLFGLVLTLALGGTALAATGVAVDGQVYAFTGDVTSFEADGKTFRIEGDTIRIQEPGKADRVLPLETATEQAAVAQDSDLSVAVEACYATIVMEDTVAAEAASEMDIATASTYISEGGSSIRHANFDAYAKFGLSHDAQENALYYQGRRVRVFQDSYPLDNFSCSALENYDPAGVIDVEAQRDLSTTVYNPDGSQDPGGVLTGLRVLSDAEFAARDMVPWTAPEQQMTAVSEGEPMTSAEKQAFYAPYATLGIAYDAAADRLSYQGQTIRRFLDVLKSNGESLSGGRFKGSMTQMSYDSGDIDVTIVRDYTQPDAEGNGKIIGVHVENVK